MPDSLGPIILHNAKKNCVKYLCRRIFVNIDTCITVLRPIMHWELWSIPGICNRGFITAPDDAWIAFNSSVKLVRTSLGESVDPSPDPFRSCWPSLMRRSMIGWANRSLIPLPDIASLRVVATFGSRAVMSCWNTCSAVSPLFRGAPSWIKLYRAQTMWCAGLTYR